MKRSCAWRLTALLLLAVPVLFAGCGDDDDTTTNVGPTTQVTALTTTYFPFNEENVWEFVRMERGVEGANPDEDYYDPSNPAGLTRWEITSTGGDEFMFVAVTTNVAGTEEIERLEIPIVADTDHVELVSLDRVQWQDESSPFFFVTEPQNALLGHDWIRFNQVEWTLLEEDYADADMGVNYDGDEEGKVIVREALGYDYDRDIYDGGDQPGATLFDESDIDFDTYIDGISHSRIVGRVRAETDFVFNSIRSMLGNTETVLEDYCPDLVGMTFADCKWVALSVKSDLFLSNQRDPNTTAGGQAINEEYLSEDAITIDVFRDIQLMLLAPGVGPVMVISCVDLDKLMKVGDYEDPVYQFQPDVFRYDILRSSTTLP